MEVLLEILFQFLGELLLQIFAEILAEGFFRSVAEPFRRPKPLNPWLAAAGYMIFGTVVGGLSLWLVPGRLIKEPYLRVANLILAPVLAGYAMTLMGAWRRKRGQDIVRLDTFTYGYCFAVAMALVRLIYGA